ncbi:MAG: hypothetical protein IPK08_15725 [Bacteroidetes bacterium]|nr:hypothetical protein [Bacteroidota bacterium]
MKYELVELETLSGNCATIYAVIVDNEESTLFDQFLQGHLAIFSKEIEEIYQTVSIIGHETGARQDFFKEREGKPGDGVCALYDKENSSLRLYCIRYGTVAIVLGGGAVKPKATRAWQDDPKLKHQAELMIKISADIMKRIRDKEINWSRDGRHLIGLGVFEIE